jgi:hypothetical protein
MPFTLNGFGTSYYGKRLPAEGGSYVTTLWITALWVPLIPLGSYRVRPVGKPTNVIVHHSQNFQTARVPLCWPQVRNGYVVTIPILAILLFGGWSDITKWWQEDIRKSGNAPVVIAPEPAQSQPFESEVELNEKQAQLACGKTLKLGRTTFDHLNIHPRLSQLLPASGFTQAEIDDPASKDLETEAFQAYSLGFLTWDKPKQMSRGRLDQMIVNAVKSVDISKLTVAEKAQLEQYLVKFKRMMLSAFELGRHDAKISPCIFF